ncbi:hypothetical protein [Psychrobacter sp. 16-MNA-CIBAN-0192]|uniref:hypothetical protein n=1 Tax=Psychrobacter sp. 16-MNA-CIBAN-0192 TaxID=3140448 RepID=UPI0033265B0D
MLRLNHSSVVRKAQKGIESVRMLAVFDDVTKSGDVQHELSQRFNVKDNVLTLNGVQHQLSEPVNLNADPEDLMHYFAARFASAQPDIFLEPPQSKGGARIPVSIKEVHWEYPDMTWRGIDKGGTVAYFAQRPKLDNAGYWVAATEGVMPKYGKSICIASDYKRSLRSK